MSQMQEKEELKRFRELLGGASGGPTIEQILIYEAGSSWWAGWIGCGPMQDIAGRYLAWKCRRKFARYQRFRNLSAIKLKSQA